MPRRKSSVAKLSTSPSSISTRGAMMPKLGEMSPLHATAGHGPRPKPKRAKRPKLGGMAAKDHGAAVPAARKQHARDSVKGKAQPQIVRETRSVVNKPTKKTVPKVKKKVRAHRTKA